MKNGAAGWVLKCYYYTDTDGSTKPIMDLILLFDGQEVESMSGPWESDEALESSLIKEYGLTRIGETQWQLDEDGSTDEVDIYIEFLRPELRAVTNG